MDGTRACARNIEVSRSHGRGRNGIIIKSKNLRASTAAKDSPGQRGTARSKALAPKFRAAGNLNYRSRRTLKEYFQSELILSPRMVCVDTADGAKGGIVDVAIREPELRMIQHIERFHPELDIEVFGFEILEK